MKNVLNSAFWTGVVLFAFVIALFGIIVYGAANFAELSSSEESNDVVCDTVYVEVEVIKEVPVECTKKHLEVPKPAPVQQLPVKVQQDTLSDTNI
jgi:hypothetical protein